EHKHFQQNLGIIYLSVCLLKKSTGDNNKLFFKFINNARAAPVCSIGPDSVHYPIAIFLCFMQHVQYEKSKGLVFLSDLQGLPTHLRDPQITTSP
ncbi:unnamed protein product, partial [Mycena citricolor]